MPSHFDATGAFWLILKNFKSAAILCIFLLRILLLRILPSPQISLILKFTRELLEFHI